MADERSIALINFESGEYFDTKIKFKDNRFIARGHKMYNFGITALIDVLSKEEFKTIVNSFDSENVNYYNIYTKQFSEITPLMEKSNRSKLKKKLIEKRFLLDYNGKLMLNPYTFVPRGDNNIVNCNYLTQQVWKYLVDDCNNYSDAIEKHMHRIFDTTEKKKTHIKIKNKFYEAPKS